MKKYIYFFVFDLVDIIASLIDRFLNHVHAVNYCRIPETVITVILMFYVSCIVFLLSW